MVEDKAAVVAASCRPQRSLLPYAHAIDLACVPADLAHCVATVCCDAVTEFLLAVTDCDNTLAVSIPSEIVYPSGYDLILALCNSAARRTTVPNADSTGTISRSTIEARWRKPCYCRGTGVGRVLGG